MGLGPVKVVHPSHPAKVVSNPKLPKATKVKPFYSDNSPVMNPNRVRVPIPVPNPHVPTAATVAAKKHGGGAGLFGGIGPVAYVNNEFAPIEAQIAAQQKARNDNYNQLVGAILQSLATNKGLVPSYQGLQQDTASAAQGAAQTLNAANPTASTNALLQSIGAPAAQQQQVQMQNAAAFNPALSQYVNGAIPGSVLAQDRAAEAGYVNSLPAIVGSQALQGLTRLGTLASNENLDLAGKKVQALTDARNSLADFVQKNKALAQNAAIASAQFGLNQAKTAASIKQGNARIAAQNASVNERVKHDVALEKAAKRSGDLAAWKAARAQENTDRKAAQADRAYQLSLSRLGIEKDRLALQAKSAANRQKTGGLTVYEKTHLVKQADDAAHDFYFGKKGAPHYDSSTGQWIDGPTTQYSIPYQQAIHRLVDDYHLTVGDATKIANRYYPPGQFGRPRLSKAAQARVNAAIPKGPLDMLISGKYK